MHKYHARKKRANIYALPNHFPMYSVAALAGSYLLLCPPSVIHSVPEGAHCHIFLSFWQENQHIVQIQLCVP